MKFLICYATTEGQTRKVAEYMADVAVAGGATPTLIDAAMVGDISVDSYAGVIFAGSVHMGRYQSALTRLIERHRDALNRLPSAFVSVSLSAASDDPHVRSEIDECAQNMLREAGWMPRAVLHAAGAFRFAEYDLFRRWIARMLAAQMGKAGEPLADTEYTDWNEVRTFVETFVNDHLSGAGDGGTSG